MATSEIKRRISQVKKLLRSGAPDSLLIVSSAPVRIRNRDAGYPYRQDSNFYYLTGIEQQDLALVIFPETKEKPVLVGPPVDPMKTVWEGEVDSVATLARRIGAKALETKDTFQELLKLCKGRGELFFQNVEGTLSFRIAKHLLEIPEHRRESSPSRFTLVERVLTPLRSIKSPQEVKEIGKALEISYQSLLETVPMIRAGVSEREIKARLESEFFRRGAVPAFDSIVAAGKSAATLHYHRHERVLRKGELLLIDFGAEQHCMASDITRVFPVSGTFEGIHRELYECVLEAEKQAIRAVRPGVQISKVYEAASKVLVQGLRDLKILTGSLSSLLRNKDFRKYFPHGIGHSLGLDVHDVGNLRGNLEPKLEKGMVLTIEPGLYFPKKTGKVPPCGIRIEDDILVSSSGAKNLSEKFPKECQEIESLFS